jgi:acetyltransferase-like isoleucine patch superfamily enzyme
MKLKPNWFQRFLYSRYRKLYKLLFGVQTGVILRGYPEYIHIGDNVRIASNVQIITRNHDLKDISKYEERKDVYICDNCWIGANAIILPGVTLGEHTIVGAGSVVTKNFTNGFCVIAGNPAKKIKNIEIEESDIEITK